MAISQEKTFQGGESTFEKSEATSYKEAEKKSLLEREKEEINKLLLKPHNLSSEDMLDKAKLCEEFRKSYKKQ